MMTWLVSWMISWYEYQGQNLSMCRAQLTVLRNSSIILTRVPHSDYAPTHINGQFLPQKGSLNNQLLSNPLAYCNALSNFYSTVQKSENKDISHKVLRNNPAITVSFLPWEPFRPTLESSPIGSVEVVCSKFIYNRLILSLTLKYFEVP